MKFPQKFKLTSETSVCLEKGETPSPGSSNGVLRPAAAAHTAPTPRRAHSHTGSGGANWFFHVGSGRPSAPVPAREVSLSQGQGNTALTVSIRLAGGVSETSRPHGDVGLH